MAFENLADLIIRTGIWTFGQPVMYYPLHGVPVEIRAIFDAAFLTVDPNTGVSIGAASPAIDIRLADLCSSPSPGDRVVINCEMYRVVSHQQDGHGASKLILHKL